MNQAANHYVPANVTVAERAVWDRINFMLGEVAKLRVEMSQVLQAAARPAEVASLRVAVQAVQDQLTQVDTFVGALNTSFTPSGAQALTGGGDGFTIEGNTAGVAFSVSGPGVARVALGLGVLATKSQAADVPAVAGSAGATYDAATITLIDGLASGFNTLVASLLAAGVTA